MPVTTCPVHTAPADPIPFLSNGDINFKAHNVGWIVCGFFSSVATVASLWLIWKHVTYYTCPQQQRHIIRMLLMVPIYAIISTLSYIFYSEAVYFATVRDCYEAVVITSFFNLIVQYMGDTPAEQNEVFRQVKLKKWFFPFCKWKYRPDGLHFLWLMKIGILQYAILQPICTLIAVGLQYYGLYCLESWQPYFGHIWLSLTISISISIAMYNIIQIYLPISEELKPYSPVLKFLAVKCIVFLTFWQDSFLSLLVYLGAIKETKYFTTSDIQVGLSALLVTFEMMIFSFIHVKAFTYLLYRPQDRSRKTKRGKALLDVIDFRDWWKDMQSATRYVKARRQGRDYTIADDIRRQKYAHLEQALGRDRQAVMQLEQQKSKKEQMPTFWADGKGDTEEEENGLLLISTADLEKAAGTASRKREEVETQPRRLRAMRDDFDPEVDEEGDLEDGTTHPAVTLPQLEYERRSSRPAREAHPELTLYHSVVADDDSVVGLSLPDHVMVPHKGGRARKEGSAGLGAWWRAFRERISGNGLDEEREEDAEYQEKASMLADEIGRGIVGKTGEDERMDDVPLPPLRPIQRTSTASSDASDSVLRSRDSPLSLIIKENSGQKGEGGTATLKSLAEYEKRQIAITHEAASGVARHSSKRAALDEFDAAGPRPTLVKEVGQYVRGKPAEAPPVQSVEPSVSAASATPSKSVSTNLSPSPSSPPAASAAMHDLSPISAKVFPLLAPPPLRSFPIRRTPAVLAAPSVIHSYPQEERVSDGRRGTSRIPRLADSAKIVAVEVKSSARMQVIDDPEAEPVSRAGYVVPGGQSLSQIKASKRPVDGREGQRQTQEIGTDHTQRQKQTSRFNEERETSLQQPGVTMTAAGRQEPYILLPAPSQLAQRGNRQDPYAAAIPPPSRSRGVDSREQRKRQQEHQQPSNAVGSQMIMHPSQHQQQHRHTKPRHSIEVGAVLNRQDIMNVQTPQQPRHHHHSQRPPFPHDREQQQQQHRPAVRQPRNSDGSVPRPSAALVTYHPYTGEPVWTSPAAHDPRPSRVERQRQRFEAPPGYNFDYID